MARPVDPAALRLLPELRRTVATLGVVGSLRGVATVAGVFALAALVTDVAAGHVIAGPAVALLGLVTLRGALGVVGERVGADSAARVSAAVRRRLLADRLARRADDGTVDVEAVRTLAVQGAASIEPYVVRFLPALVTAAVVPVSALVALVFVDPLSAIVVACTLPLLPLFAALIGAGTRDATERRWQALADLAGHFRDAVLGLPTLAGYGRARHQARVVDGVGQRHRTATMRTLRLAFLSAVALELLATICVAIVAVFVGIRLAAGGLDLQTGLTAILLAPEAYWPIRRVGSEFHSAADGSAALTRAAELLPPETTGPQRTPAGSPAIEVRALTYRHPGRPRDTLTGVELDAGPGLTAITGPSGVGKSTLLELIAGLRTPTTGQVRAGRTHLVAQRPLLTAGSVRENLTLSCPAGDRRLWSALSAVALADAVADLPAGLDTVLGEDGGTLSAGQRSRLAVARALVDDAPVVLLDEPTAHLDVGSAAAVHAAIAELARTRCVVVVTHRDDLADAADHRIVLGPVAEVVPV